MRYIPAAIYRVGADDGYPEEAPPHTVKIHDFYIDEAPVTNAEYRAFCDATGKPYPLSPEWEEYDNYFLDCPNSPVVRVSRLDAIAYARWAGKRLPSEAEWEYAASGGARGAAYPWGTNEYEANKYANFADSCSDYEWRNPYFNDGYKHASPVKTYLPNHFGLYDMAGNVWEWTGGHYYDYSDTEFGKSAPDGIINNIAVQRGGCYHSTIRDLRISRRRRAEHGAASNFCGFRCAIDAADAERLLAGDRSADPVLSPLRGNGTPVVRSAVCEPELPVGASTTADKAMLCAVIDPGSDTDLRRLAELGFGCVEQPVTWASCEKKGRGEWDFSEWDRLYTHARGAGLRWRPCFIAGPAYSLPNWFRQSRDYYPAFCLEHGMTTCRQSIWDKRFFRHIERFFAAAAEHQSRYGQVEELTLDVCSVSGSEISNDGGIIAADKSDCCHVHAGYWCGDSFAREDFKSTMVKKYGDINNLNTAWGESFIDFNKICYPPVFTTPLDFRVDEPTAAGRIRCASPEEMRRLIDFIDWYRASKTEYCAAGLKLAKRYFPGAKLWLQVGGQCESWMTAEQEEQCKIAAEYGAGVIVKGAGCLTPADINGIILAVSAGTFYGTEIALCGAFPKSEKQAAALVHIAAASGASELQINNPTIRAGAAHTENYSDGMKALSNNLQFLRRGTPKREIAVLYPDLPAIFDPSIHDYTRRFMAALRDFADFACIGDISAADGALGGVRALFLIAGGVYRNETLRKIKKFVNAGGLLIAVDVAELTALDGDKFNKSDFAGMLLHKRVNGTRNIGRGATLRIDLPRSEENRNAIQHRYTAQISEFLLSRGVDLPDGRLDGEYVVHIKPEDEAGGLLLAYNETDGITEKKIK